MPIVITTDFPNIDTDLYKKTHRLVMGNERPVGLIAHCCQTKGSGISVIDIWESKEAFDAFTEERIIPALQKLEIKGGPENLTITDLLNADAFDYRGSVLS